MKFPKTPEVIATVDAINADGDEANYGDRIIGIQVRQDKNTRDGIVDIDVRELDKKLGSLIIRLPLPELMAALSCATLNAERDDNV